jgi:hypothetical protein
MGMGGIKRGLRIIKTKQNKKCNEKRRKDFC